MPTKYQLLRTRRVRQKRRSRAPSLTSCPQKKGVCTRILVTSPKKPNSANRRIAKILIVSTKRRVTAHIPGIGHNLQRHGSVLIRGGRVRDLPGVRYRAIRGKYDLGCLVLRRQGRSKYGMKKY